MSKGILTEIAIVSIGCLSYLVRSVKVLNDRHVSREDKKRISINYNETVIDDEYLRMSATISEEEVLKLAPVTRKLGKMEAIDTAVSWEYEILSLLGQTGSGCSILEFVKMEEYPL